MATEYTAEESARLAEIEAEIAKYESQYKALHKQLQPLWNERASIRTASRQRERCQELEGISRRYEEDQKALIAAGLEYLADEGKSAEPFYARFGLRYCIGNAKDIAAKHIFANPPHPLMPVALKYWRERKSTEPIIDTRALSESEVADLAAQFRAAGYTIKYENRAA
jgi:chromosome segregation ATPase